MKKILLLLGILVSTVSVSWAQPEAAAGHIPTEKALLWEISGKDLQKPSYLFGTIHIIKKDDYFFTPTMEKALMSTDGVAFEIDMEDMSDLSKIMGMMSSMYMKDDQTLRDLLNDEDYEKVNAHFKEMGLPLAFLERIKPMFLSMMAGGGEDMMGFSMDGESNSSMVSYEMQLMDMAKKGEKDITGLETMEFQMSLFDSIPYDAQAKMLLASIDAEGQSEEGENQLDMMVRLYKAQDIQGMQNIMSDEPDALGGYEDLLLQKRNHNWIPIMSDMMSEKPVFFAVGAGHLGGEEGVISLLRQAGYTVEAVIE